MGPLLTRALQTLAHDAPDEVAAEVAPRVRRWPRRLEAVAAARDRLPCRVACCARRDAQRVSTLQSGATRAGAPHRCQFTQLNELRLSGHGPVGPRLRPALSSSQSGAGGTAGRAPVRRRPGGPGRAAGECRGERRNGNLGARAVSARERSGAAGAAAGDSCGVPALLSFLSFIPRATPLPLTTNAKGHAETGVFWRLALLCKRKRVPTSGRHLRPCRCRCLLPQLRQPAP